MARRLSGSSAAAGLRQTFSTTHSHTTIIVLLCACWAPWVRGVCQLVGLLEVLFWNYRHTEINLEMMIFATVQHKDIFILYNPNKKPEIHTKKLQH